MLQPSLLQITRTQEPKTPPPPSSLVFGHTFVSELVFEHAPYFLIA